MNKQKMLKVVNPVLAILMLNQALSGMLHDLLPHEVFEVLHTFGWVMIIFAVIHVHLNWGWVKANLLSRSRGGQD